MELQSFILEWIFISKKSILFQNYWGNLKHTPTFQMLSVTYHMTDHNQNGHQIHTLQWSSYSSSEKRKIPYVPSEPI